MTADLDIALCSDLCTVLMLLVTRLKTLLASTNIFLVAINGLGMKAMRQTFLKCAAALVEI